MDLYQLRYFLEAARELNFTRAAGNLHLSPSAMSRSIGLLERSVGRPLFARSKRRVALSAAGEALRARAERIFDEVEAARADLSGAAAAPAVLRIGSREMITNYLLPGPLGDYKARWGETRFAVFELPPAELAAALAKDQLDLGFYYEELPAPGLEARLLGRLRSHVFAARGYLSGARRPKSTRDLLEHPFIVPGSFAGDPAAPRADGFPDRRHPRKIRYEADSLESHRRFVLAGLCVGVLPDLVMEAERRRGDVVALEGPAVHRDVWCFRRAGRILPPAVETLVAAVRRSIRSLA